MEERVSKTYVSVLSRKDSGSWHQPMKYLRDWHRERLIQGAREAACAMGFRSYTVFDADEDAVHMGYVD